MTGFILSRFIVTTAVFILPLVCYVLVYVAVWFAQLSECRCCVIAFIIVLALSWSLGWATTAMKYIDSHGLCILVYSYVFIFLCIGGAPCSSFRSQASSWSTTNVSTVRLQVTTRFKQTKCGTKRMFICGTLWILRGSLKYDIYQTYTRDNTGYINVSIPACVLILLTYNDYFNNHVHFDSRVQLNESEHQHDKVNLHTSFI